MRSKILGNKIIWESKFKRFHLLGGNLTIRASLAPRPSVTFFTNRSEGPEMQKRLTRVTLSVQIFSSCAIFLGQHAICCTILRIFEQFCRVLTFFAHYCTFLHVFAHVFAHVFSAQFSNSKMCQCYILNFLQLCEGPSRGTPSVRDVFYQS